MPSVLAIVSKAVFDKMVPNSVSVGDLVATDHYPSTVKALETLGDGGALFLVTVRPLDQRSWLVAILEAPTLEADGWHAAPNQTPITDVTAAIPQLAFASRTKRVAKPCVLAASDEAALRAAAGAGRPAFQVTRAVRLVREDIERLTALHQKQFHAMMAPSSSRDQAAALVGAGRDTTSDDGGGLVYLRLEDPANPERAFEVWISDTERPGSTSVSADGAVAFVGGTVDRIGLEMSQSSWHPTTTPDAAAVLAFLSPRLRRLKLAVTGAAMTADPPFARSSAPKPRRPGAEAGALDLVVVAARRLTETEARALPPASRFQLLHSLRPAFATVDPEQMEDPMQLGMVYGFIDPGPDANGFGFRHGLVYLRVRTTEPSPREYEGWFFDARIEDEQAYWPSPKAVVTRGRFFEPGSVRFTGVEVKDSCSIIGGKLTFRPRVAVDATHGLPVANALAAAVKTAGFSFDVEVLPRPRAGETGYFGTAEHAKAVEQQRRGHAAEEAEKARKKRGTARRADDQ